MHPAWRTASSLHPRLLHVAYGWLLLTGVLHFGIDVLSQAARGRRLSGPETTLYYGLNTSYSLSQVLFALTGLLAIRNGVEAIGRWPGLTLGFGAVVAWLAICVLFLEYSQPRITVGLFAALLPWRSLQRLIALLFHERLTEYLFYGVLP